MEKLYSSPSLLNYIPLIFGIGVGLIFFSIGLKVLINLIIEKVNFFKMFFVYIICIVFIVAGGYAVGAVIENIYYETRYVLIPYMQGNYEEIEGIVENCVISEDERDMDFEVNGVKFECTNFEASSVGYQGTALKNGDYVRVRYLRFQNEELDFSYVMKLERQKE